VVIAQEKCMLLSTLEVIQQIRAGFIQWRSLQKVIIAEQCLSWFYVLYRMRS